VKMVPNGIEYGLAAYAEVLGVSRSGNMAKFKHEVNGRTTRLRGPERCLYDLDWGDSAEVWWREADDQHRLLSAMSLGFGCRLEKAAGRSRTVKRRSS
jgi:6-phosphogluconate dehydrogenase (decarboxylating)